jgi:hypothetical protein
MDSLDFRPVRTRSAYTIARTLQNALQRVGGCCVVRVVVERLCAAVVRVA